MKDWDEKALLQELRHEQRQREIWLRYAAQLSRKATYRRARAVEQRIIRQLQGRGFLVNPTPHNAPFDVWVGGLKVEIKYSHWRAGARRYQGHIRNHQADLLIFDAINGTDHYFIIPMAEIRPRQTVEISRYEVELYRGQWRGYLERWDVLRAAVEAVPPLPVQLNFGQIA